MQILTQNKEILQELKKIKVNEKGKIINFELLNIEECNSDFSQDKTIFVCPPAPPISSFHSFCIQNKKEPSLVIFDSAPHCKTSEDSRLKDLIEAGFPAENILLVGIRELSQEELIFLNSRKIKRISMNELNNDIEEITDIIMEFSSGKEPYISFNLSIIDPIFTSLNSSPGGLTSRQAIYILSRINLMKNLKAIDINTPENNPQLNKLIAKLLSEII
ncbi:arginase family protein [Candidatus Pacearchaeota archaeon]|nr:arginase family protein [Candidatus Pacearchaeota archaeon]